MTVKVWLDGHQSDLEALAQVFSTGETRVVREDHRYYLTSPAIDNPPEGTKPYIVAGQLLVTLNGLCAVHHEDFRPVALAGAVTDSGSVTIYPDPARVEVRGGRPTSAHPPNEPSPWPGRIALAASHPDLAEVLSIMGGAQLGWPGLYAVYEIIRQSIKQTEVHELLGVDRRTVGRFTGSAQAGRHARPSGLPSDPMTLAQGRDFVNHLVEVWMNSLDT